MLLRGGQAKLILGGAWLVAIAYAFPGYMNFDAAEQLYQARTRIDDWHPPVMAGYWHMCELVTRGPFLMLVLQTTLFLWGLYAVVRMRCEARTAAIVASALLLFPPILTPMAPVWKDAQMAAFLLAGVMLMMRESRGHRLLGCGLLLLAVGVRDNGAAAVLPLLVLVTHRWFARRWQAWVAAVGLFVVLVASAQAMNRGLRDVPAYPWFTSTAIHDIAGTICHAGPMTDQEVRAALGGIPITATSELQRAICAAYAPRVWFGLVYGERHVFAFEPAKSDRLARRAAWRRLVRERPDAFLAHRWAVAREVLGLTESEPWEPVCQTFGATPEQRERLRQNHSRSWIQRRVGELFLALSRTPLYRPWIYVVLSLIVAGYALVRRRGVVLAFVASGLAYEASACALAAAPDFRYSHWMITCTCVGVVLVFVERWRA